MIYSLIHLKYLENIALFRSIGLRPSFRDSEFSSETIQGLFFSESANFLKLNTYCLFFTFSRMAHVLIRPGASNICIHYIQK